MTNLLMVVNSVNKKAEMLGFSGSTLIAKMLGSYFKNQGFELSILTTHEGAKFFKNNNLDVDFFITSKLLKKMPLLLTFIINFIFSIKYIFRIKNIDVIYSTSDLLPDVLFSSIFKLLNRKAIFICGCYLLVEKISQMRKYYFRSSAHQAYSYYSQRIFLRVLKKLADLILVLNYVDRSALIKNGFREKQVMVAYGASERKYIEKVFSQKQSKIYDLLFLGNEHPRKGIGVMEYLLNKIIKNNNSLKVAIVGWLPHLKERFNGYKNFHFLGILSGLEKYTIIAQSKLLVLPSYHESFSLVACEAISCATPVVAFDTEIFRSIYKKGMIFTPYADKEAMYNEITSLLKNEERLNSLSQEAKEFAKTFSWDKTGKQILDYIHSQFN